MKKTAFFTMDVESFKEISCLREKPRAEYDSFRIEHAIDDFLDLLGKYNVKATFFVLCSSLEHTKKYLNRAHQEWHEIALHGLTHDIPTQMKREELERQIGEGKALLEREFGTDVIGYRAPCFAVTDDVIDVISKLGFKYDSSFLDIKMSYRRSTAKMDGFERVCDGILRRDSLFEISPCKVKTAFGTMSISGGGHVRLAPHSMVFKWLKKFLKTSDYYMFYCHPADIFKEKPPKLKGISPLNAHFIKAGREKFLSRAEGIIKLLIDEGYTFSTMREYINNEINN